MARNRIQTGQRTPKPALWLANSHFPSNSRLWGISGAFCRWLPIQAADQILNQILNLLLNILGLIDDQLHVLGRVRDGALPTVGIPRVGSKTLWLKSREVMRRRVRL